MVTLHNITDEELVTQITNSETYTIAPKGTVTVPERLAQTLQTAHGEKLTVAAEAPAVAEESVVEEAPKERKTRSKKVDE